LLVYALRIVISVAISSFSGQQAGTKACSAYGGPGTAYGPGNGSHFKQHLAFVVTLPELFRATESLQRNGIETLGFWGGKASEPTVIGWMPSAQIYFRDPDEHMLELIAILAEEPDVGFNGPYSEWQKRRAGQS
jgi:catechol 2,3-dioxygenase-like lactoylglutathione lyase family enzyme